MLLVLACLALPAVLLYLRNSTASYNRGLDALAGSARFIGQRAAATHVVEYRVKQSGTCPYGCVADLTLFNAQGGTEQIGDASLPWSRRFDVASGEFVYLSAQAGQGVSEITAEVWIDGRSERTSTSKRQYAIRTSSCLVP